MYTGQVTPACHVRKRPAPALACLLLYATMLVGCNDTRAGRTELARLASSDTILMVVADTPGPELARPFAGFVSPSGEFIVGDESDRDVKVYSSNGQLARTVGRAGAGPGEFRQVGGVEVIHDSMYVYDFDSKRITVFDGDGVARRSILLSADTSDRRFAWTMVSNGAKALMLLSSPVGIDREDLIVVRSLDGSRTCSMLNASDYLQGRPALIQSTDVTADGDGQLMFAVLRGTDSLFVFGPECQRVAAFQLPGSVDGPKGRLQTIAQRLEAAGGQSPAQVSGALDGLEIVYRLIALGDSTIAIEYRILDTKNGVDGSAPARIRVAKLWSDSLLLVSQPRIVIGDIIGTSSDDGLLAIGLDSNNKFRLQRLVVAVSKQ